MKSATRGTPQMSPTNIPSPLMRNEIGLRMLSHSFKYSRHADRRTASVSTKVAIRNRHMEPGQPAASSLMQYSNIGQRHAGQKTLSLSLLFVSPQGKLKAGAKGGKV